MVPTSTPLSGPGQTALSPARGKRLRRRHRHRSGAQFGGAGGVDQRVRLTGLTVEQEAQAEFRRQSLALVIVKITDHLDTRGDGGCNISTQHVNMDPAVLSTTRCKRDSITGSPSPWVRKLVSIGARIQCSVSAVATTSGPLRCRIEFDFIFTILLQKMEVHD